MHKPHQCSNGLGSQEGILRHTVALSKGHSKCFHCIVKAFMRLTGHIKTKEDPVDVKVTLPAIQELDNAKYGAIELSMLNRWATTLIKLTQTYNEIYTGRQMDKTIATYQGRWLHSHIHYHQGRCHDEVKETRT